MFKLTCAMTEARGLPVCSLMQLRNVGKCRSRAAANINLQNSHFGLRFFTDDALLKLTNFWTCSLLNQWSWYWNPWANPLPPPLRHTINPRHYAFFHLYKRKKRIIMEISKRFWNSPPQKKLGHFLQIQSGRKFQKLERKSKLSARFLQKRMIIWISRNAFSRTFAYFLSRKWSIGKCIRQASINNVALQKCTRF